VGALRMAEERSLDSVDSASENSEDEVISFEAKPPPAAKGSEAEVLKLCALSNRGQGATLAERDDIDAAIARLAATPGGYDSSLLNGEWRLVYASEAVTRSSPFFWAFRKATKSAMQPLPLLPPDLSEALFAITDGIPFASVGRATQRISGMGAEGRGGSLVSSVEVALRVFDALLPPNVGYVTTSSRLLDMGGGKVRLTVETTEVKDSTWGEIPVFGPAFEGVKFPSGDALERVKPGSSSVDMAVAYVSEEMRVTRNEEGQVFVHVRV